MKFFAVCVCVAFMLTSCSDFYKKDFVHIASAHYKPKDEKSIKEREIQAMRKSQILQDNHTRVLMIARYVNEINKEWLENTSGEVFLIEVYDKLDEISEKNMKFSLKTAYNSVESSKIEKLDSKNLGTFTPDIAYNDVYLVTFDRIGERGKDALKLFAEIKGVGRMSFDFGYAKRESKLTQ
ncbi:Uncharacterised protein [Helicobacter cinaedi]|uniref:Lipoprotein n=1 Tax=Helicobacter cinaedi TaxID=213 RepID=A0A377JT82_9HELI|nr:hypothetical protein [Helicobacter cinaedi]STP10455.1 Uncharacterised protein [Helicobacter cinaedi]